MTLETKSREYRDVLEARYLVTLAESIFTVWLGALAGTKGDNCSLRDHCPWGDNLAYRGCSSHNPLTKDVTLPRPPVQLDALYNGPSVENSFLVLKET